MAWLSWPHSVSDVVITTVVTTVEKCQRHAFITFKIVCLRTYKMYSSLKTTISTAAQSQLL